jgi:hypothetical protein
MQQVSQISTLRTDATAGQPFAGHGRSPTIEMRHTVDDKLLVATHAAFCSLRAMLHRNGDTIVLLSDVGKEVRLRGQSIPRGVVLTDCHVYVLSLPSNALFAPASSGGCFSLKEFARLCTVETSPHVVLQFVNGVVTLLFDNQEDVARIAQIVFSATGVVAEKISEEDLDLAQHGEHYARSGSRRYAVSVAPSTVSKAQSRRESVPSVGASSLAGKRVLGSGGASSEGSQSNAPQVVETMLRHILGGRSGDYEKSFPEVECQTDAWCGTDQAVAACPQTVERGSSPVGFPEDAADQQSEASASDFDPADVWRSLRANGGVPPSKHADPAIKRTLTSQRFESSAAAVGAAGPSGTSTATSGGAGTPQIRPAGNNGLQRRMSFASKTLQEEEDQAADEQQRAGQRLQQLEAFLGVLSSFLPQLQGRGIDCISKLVKMTDAEIEEVMDSVGMLKQGHRIMLVNKVALARQARKK